MCVNDWVVVIEWKSGEPFISVHKDLPSLCKSLGLQAQVYSKGMKILVSKITNLVCKLYVVAGKEECAFQSPVLLGTLSSEL